jgi:galactose mutarotase-like enzyme
VGYETLRLSNGDVVAEVVPARGALVTSLSVGGTDVLFLDRSTLDDPAKNVRGGIPVLFPYAGRLVDDLFALAGTRMKQHGFGRNKPWAVQESSAGSAWLRLAQDEDTRAQYPYEYDAHYGIHLLPRGVQVELVVTNGGARPLPVSPGWHPYFRCPAALKARVRGDVPGLDAHPMGDGVEFDFGLEAPASGRTRFEVPGLGTLRIDFSPALRHLQFWSQPGRDFVCLEPFFGPANTVNTDRRLDVPPGQARDLWMRIEAFPRA